MNRVKVGFFSLSHRSPTGDDRPYLQWHQLDHLPEQYQLPGMILGRRWASTPACRSARAAEVGEYLRSRLRGLAARDGRLGEVRGTGLMNGIDVLGGGEAGDTADRRAFARALLDALRDQQVLAGLTGPASTVLKLRPPLIWREEHAGQCADAIETALRQLP